MIQRINFIEKNPFVLNYRKMVVFGGGLFGLVLLIYGMQFFRAVRIEKKAAALTAEVTRLKVEQERRLKEMSTDTSGTSAGAQAALIQFFEDPMSWSVLLGELTSQTPNSLWLTSFKSYEKADLPSKRGMTLAGRAEDASAVTFFVKSLSDSPYFERVILTDLKQETGVKGESYQFTIDLALTSQKREKGGKA